MQSEVSETVDPVKRRRIRIMLTAVIAFLILFALTDRICRMIAYRRMNDREKLISICKINFRPLRLAGFKLAPGETLREFKDRIGDRIPSELLEFLDLYERILYSSETPDKETVSKMEQNRKELIAYLFNQIFHAAV